MLILFSLVLARVGGLLIGAPIFGAQNFPARYRLMLGLVLTSAILPAVGRPTLPEGGAAVMVAMAAEFVIGMSIGALARLLLTAFQIGGAMIALQMGFAVARIFDPESGMQTALVGTLYLQLVTLLFLILDGHHLLIRSVASSYEAFPLGAPLPTAPLAATIFASGAAMYESAARMAGPVAGLMLLINAIVGLINRAIPQLSIFNIGFPLTVFSGLVALALSVPETVAYFLHVYESFEIQVASIFMG